MKPDASLIFTPEGLGECVYSEVIDLGLIGRLSVRRATFIEFDQASQYWRVHDPEGFELFSAPTREACLDWEARHLGEQEEVRHGLLDSTLPVAVGT